MRPGTLTTIGAFASFGGVCHECLEEEVTLSVCKKISGTVPRMSSSDGYYFRDDNGRLHGPLTRFQYEAWTLRGDIRPGTRVWRQQAGNTYKIAITRRLRWGKLASQRAVGTCAEWLMVASSIMMLLFLFSIPKLRSEIAKEMSGQYFSILFFVLLVVVTLGMSVATIRKLSGRLQDETTEVFESEV